MTDKELDWLATQELESLWPSSGLWPHKQKTLLSINRCDWHAGFLVGAKKILEILDLNIKKAGP